MMSEDDSSTDDFLYLSPDHSNNVISKLRDLLTRDCFTDVTLEVRDQRIRAHRLVLCAASPYFEAMFMSGMSEVGQKGVQLHGIEKEHLQLIVDFIYSGRVSINSQNVQELLAAADLLQVTEVVAACTSYLRRELHPSNCLGILKLAETFSCAELGAAARAYAEQNFVEVGEQEEFLEASVEVITGLFASEYLCIEQEFQVFESALRWILHSPSERRQFLVSILECVRVPLIQPSKLFGTIENCKDFSLRVALGKLLEQYDPKRRRSPSPRLPYSKFGNEVNPRHNARKYLVVMGGYHRAKSGRWHDVRPLSDVYRFDSFNRVWKAYPSMQFPRSGLTAVQVKGFTYTIGGENELLLYDNVEVFDPLEMKWVNGPSLPRPLSGHQACVLDGLIYVFGGHVGSEVTTCIMKLDPEEGKWRTVGYMPSRKTNFALAVVDGLVYIAGGSSDSGGERGLESYNPVTEEWTRLASMKHSREAFSLAVIGDFIYAVGGAKPGRDAMCSVEKYTIDQNKWATVKSLRVPRADPCVVSISGRLYVVGGRSPSRGNTPPYTLDSMEVYDPDTNTWTDDVPIPVHRCDAAVVVT